MSGFRTKIQLYTVPGQVYYNSTRKLVLRGADGVVFVADSQQEKLDENTESLRNLYENLLEQDFELREFPLVIQYNKRDLPGVVPEGEIMERWREAPWPVVMASALQGEGVRETFRELLRRVYARLDQQYELSGRHQLGCEAFVEAGGGRA